MDPGTTTAHRFPGKRFLQPPPESGKKGMRKLFWSCAAVALAAAGTVYLAAKHVDQHPYAVMGQTVRSMCGTEHESAAAPAGENAVPAEPTPTLPASTGAVEPARGEVIAVADPSMPCHIT